MSKHFYMCMCDRMPLLKRLGTHAYDPSKQTCLQNIPLCCPEGWKLVHAGSHFTSECESQYSPTKREALAVSWALDNCTQMH